jgi:hypothetical protein
MARKTEENEENRDANHLSLMLWCDGRAGLSTLQRRRTRGTPWVQGMLGLPADHIEIVACPVFAISIWDRLEKCHRLQGFHS